jgi:hypothetical protein
VFSAVLASPLLLSSADVPVVSCADVGPAVAVFLTGVVSSQGWL